MITRRLALLASVALALSRTGRETKQNIVVPEEIEENLFSHRYCYLACGYAENGQMFVEEVLHDRSLGKIFFEKEDIKSFTEILINNPFPYMKFYGSKTDSLFSIRLNTDELAIENPEELVVRTLAEVREWVSPLEKIPEEAAMVESKPGSAIRLTSALLSDASDDPTSHLTIPKLNNLSLMHPPQTDADQKHAGMLEEQPSSTEQADEDMPSRVGGIE